MTKSQSLPDMSEYIEIKMREGRVVVIVDETVNLPENANALLASFKELFAEAGNERYFMRGTTVRLYSNNTAIAMYLAVFYSNKDTILFITELHEPEPGNPFWELSEPYIILQDYSENFPEFGAFSSG